MTAYRLYQGILHFQNVVLFGLGVFITTPSPNVDNAHSRQIWPQFYSLFSFILLLLTLKAV